MTFFLHIDRKTKQFPVEKCKKLVTRSNLIIVPGVSVFWGGYSQIEAEMLLLETGGSEAALSVLSFAVRL